MTFWRSLLQTLAKNPISTFAVLCVAATGLFLAYMVIWQTNILSSPDWCNRAMNAEKLAETSRLDAALACVGLQKVQIEALAFDSHINHSTFAIIIIVLIVVVIAGARASWKLSTSGLEGSVSRHDDAAAGAAHVATAAKEAEAEVKADAAPAKAADAGLPEGIR